MRVAAHLLMSLAIVQMSYFPALHAFPLKSKPKPKKQAPPLESLQNFQAKLDELGPEKTYSRVFESLQKDLHPKFRELVLKKANISLNWRDKNFPEMKFENRALTFKHEKSKDIRVEFPTHGDIAYTINGVEVKWDEAHNPSIVWSRVHQAIKEANGIQTKTASQFLLQLLIPQAHAGFFQGAIFGVALVMALGILVDGRIPVLDKAFGNHDDAY